MKMNHLLKNEMHCVYGLSPWNLAAPIKALQLKSFVILISKRFCFLIRHRKMFKFDLFKCNNPTKEWCLTRFYKRSWKNKARFCFDKNIRYWHRHKGLPSRENLLMVHCFGLRIIHSQYMTEFDETFCQRINSLLIVIYFVP